MRKKILVVVDYQYDFFNPNGALYVNGAEKLQEKIEAIIPNFDHVIFTLDWHPLDHCSFIENGGQWPTHCVNSTIGAGIPLSMIKCAKSHSFVSKGYVQDEEEYGAFSENCDLAVEIDYTCDMFNDAEYSISYDDICIKILKSDFELVICGVA